MATQLYADCSDHVWSCIECRATTQSSERVALHIFLMVEVKLFCCDLFFVQCAEAVDEVYGQPDEYDGVGLMQEGDDDVYVGENGEDAEGDLQSDNADQPFEAVLNIGGIVLLSDNVIDYGYDDDAQPSKPTMDKDDRLRGFENVDPCGE